MKSRNGYTLIEITLVLAIVMVAVCAVVLPAGRARSVLAVHAARSELTGLAAVARSTAISTGGAALLIDTATGTAWIELPGTAVRVGGVHNIAARHGVRLSATRTPIVIRYDALGIGRVASAVIHISSGSVSGTITVSAYGRVRQS